MQPGFSPHARETLSLQERIDRYRSLAQEARSFARAATVKNYYVELAQQWEALADEMRVEGQRTHVDHLTSARQQNST